MVGFLWKTLRITVNGSRLIKRWDDESPETLENWPYSKFFDILTGSSLISA
jgi:hypothetical protein